MSHGTPSTAPSTAGSSNDELDRAVDGSPPPQQQQQLPSALPPSPMRHAQAAAAPAAEPLSPLGTPVRRSASWLVRRSWEAEQRAAKDSGRQPSLLTALRPLSSSSPPAAM
jgi:hypothetical protein